MRSGWPHTQDDHGRLPEERRSAPFGPDISWPTGYSDLEYRDGEYRYQPPPGGQPYGAPPPAPPVNKGEHPYAAFGDPGYGSDPRYTSSSIDEFGYGDPGYSNLGYDGPASEDAGVPGTRTVRGFVESGRADAGYPQRYEQGYRDPGPMEPAYPAETHSEPGNYQVPDVYREPWDYEQPLRYEGEERAYDPGDYNGSTYSRPGIDGPGYDLSGIIGTGDFEAFGYDEPSYDRLAYDDPRYQDGPGYNGSRYDGPRYDGPRFDETRMDNLWGSGGEGFRPDNGYSSDGFGGGATDRSEYPGPRNDSGTDLAIRDTRRHRGRGLDDTRFDLRADVRDRLTRMDMPVYDETRIEDLRALGPAAADRWQAATGLLAPPQDQPLDWAEQTSLDTFEDWAEQTSLDTFGGLDLDEDMPPIGAPAAFVRPGERREEDDLAAQRAAGRRRGRSGDRRQWVALGAIAVVAAGAIGGVLMKYMFHGPSGPAHTVAAPNQAGQFARMPSLEKQMKVNQLAENQIKASAGQATDVVSAVYQQGSSAPGSDPQVFMFVGGHLANASPSASIKDFTENPAYHGAQAVPPGALGGEAACAEMTANGQAASVCVWFDNDSFGEFMSSTMTPAKLATTMDTVRPNLETYANK